MEKNNCKDTFGDVKAIIWDWNGTLLDDLELSIDAMNKMLIRRNYPLLEKKRYQEIFTFPVRKYYEAAGVNFAEHEWDEVAMEFIVNYRENVSRAFLHQEVPELIDYFRQRGCRQFILSAMQQDFLEETIRERMDIGVFEKVIGLNNHYAATKSANAKMLVNRSGLEKDEIVMIGDTLHDHEVARDAGILCVLVADGHQSRKRLESSGKCVVEKLTDLKKLF